MSDDNRSVRVDLDVELDRSQVERGAVSRVQLVVQVGAVWPEGVAAVRAAPMEVVFVLDTSGSMTGEPMRQVLRSVDVLTNLLESRDSVAVVSFADRASLALPLQSCTGEVKGKIRKRLRRIFASGSTNIEAGLVRGQSVWSEGQGRDDARRVMLLMSDGVPNAGLTGQGELCGVVGRLRPEISLSTLGFGPHHDEDILASMAQRGAGGYFFIPDPSVCDVEFASALGEQGDVLLSRVQLHVAVSSGARIVRVVGSAAVEEKDQAVSIALPDLLDGRTQVVVVELEVEGALFGDVQGVAEVALDGFVQGVGSVARLEHVHVQLSEQAGGVNSMARARSLLAHAEEVRVQARLLADGESFDEAASMLRSVMDSINELLGSGKKDAALVEVQELLRDEVGIMERKPDRESYLKFKRHSMAVDLTSSSVTSGKISRSNMRSMLLRSLTSGVPRAALRVVHGPGKGATYPLGEDQILGRTSSADIQLRSHEVSRRHLRIVARSDGFYAIDLGSTNATRINGNVLEAVQRLGVGDTIQVGGVFLVYEEAKGGSVGTPKPRA